MLFLAQSSHETLHDLRWEIVSLIRHNGLQGLERIATGQHEAQACVKHIPYGEPRAGRKVGLNPYSAGVTPQLAKATSFYMLSRSLN